MPTTTARQALPIPAERPTIGVSEAAQILGVGLSTAYAAAERGELPSFRVGKAVRVPTAKFLAAYGLTDATPEAS